MPPPETVSPPHVIHLLASLDYGGSERVAAELTEALLAEGWQVTLVARDGPLGASLRQAGAGHLDWPVGRKSLATLGLIRSLRDLFRQYPDSVVHYHSRLPGWLAWLAWRSLPAERRPALVSTVHGHYSVNAYSAVMTRGQTVIAVSDSIRRYIETHYPEVPAASIERIYCGIDARHFSPGYVLPADFSAQFLERFPAARDARIICLPARVTRLKGHHHLLRLVADLIAAGVPAFGLVVGTIPRGKNTYWQEIQNLAGELGVSDRLGYAGPQADVRPWMKISDVVISVSEKPEAFGRTVVEALGLGVPVAGFDQGGVLEILNLLFPAGRVSAGDQDNLLAVVRQLLNTPPAIADPKPFSLAAMQQAHLTVYRRLLDRQVSAP